MCGVRRVAAAAIILLTAALTGCSGARPSSFSSPYEVDHPLVGVVYDVDAGARISAAALGDRLAAFDIVVLGEKHDNADHHRIQAWLLGRMIAAGRRPTLALEMLDVDDQSAIDGWRATSAGDVHGFAEAVGWAGSGWPPFSEYAPIVRTAVRAGLPIVAADLGPEALRGLGAPSTAASELLWHRLGLGREPDASVSEAMAEEIRVSHCGYVPENHVGAMAAMQRTRDAHLADSVLRTGAVRGAVLIAGAGHARTDRGVPAHLRRRAPELTIGAVAILEVAPGLERPGDYADGELPFDYVWWTPRSSDEDPCEKFRKQLEAMRGARRGS